MTVLLVEQNVAMAMQRVARAPTCSRKAASSPKARPQELLARPEIQRAYLGV